jgi:D-alanyl-lipoteichoic acid acyltransferase DltB (MBOAT superfamily)
MPLGLSFFTFAHIGYLIDVWKRRVPPERHVGRFALFGAFFPQIVSGPIPRAGHLLPQLAAPVPLDEERFCSGSATILWGLFKKLVIADRLAQYVTPVYANPSAFNGPTLAFATYFFAFQIYCDFSGYTDIAIGVARLLGVDLMENFRQPYLARSIADFWHRWHISLSTWFRDYVYIPMGGSRVRTARWVLNVMTVFLVSGLWHGASWTFVIWGGLHGLYSVVGRATSGYRESLWRHSRLMPLRPLVATIVTFHLVLVAWVFFRASRTSDALLILRRGLTDWQGRVWQGDSQLTTVISALSIAVLVLAEYLLQRPRPSASATPSFAWPVAVRWATYIVLFLCIAVLGVSSSGFIYGNF